MAKAKSWTDGLSAMAANALKGAGYQSKKDVVAALKRNEIRLKSQSEGGGSTVYSLGRKGILEVRAWAGLDKPPTKTDIKKAVKLLTSCGYRVERMSDQPTSPQEVK